jgi:histidinol-phosphate aminotransferase
MTITLTPRAELADPALQRSDGLEDERRSPALLWLDKNENRDPKHLELVARVVAKLDPAALTTYPSSARLYRKLGQWVGVDPRCLVLGAGSDGIIRSVFEAFVSPGNTVIITAPTFTMYPVYGQIYGARVVPLKYRASDNGPVLPCEEMIEAIHDQQPRLVCLPNPDSPTGTCYGADELLAIIAAAGEASAVILVDEAFHPFHPETAIPWITKFPHLIVARTTAKAWGMAALRIGYGVAAPQTIALLHKVRAMCECSTVGEAALEAMLDHCDAMFASVRRLEAGKAAFLDAMAGLGLRTLRARPGIAESDLTGDSRACVVCVA